MKKRLLVLGNGSIFTASVLRLLRGVEDLVVEDATIADVATSGKIAAFAPDFIVVDAGEGPSGAALVSQLLSQHASAKVISLTLNRTDLKVYQAPSITEASLTGLLQVIQGKEKRTTHKSRGAG